jgi:serine/threonine-protein kinase
MAEAKVGVLDLAGAERHYRDALALTLRLNGAASGVTLQTQAKLGGFLHATGRRAEGLALLVDAYTAIGRKETNSTQPAVAAIDRQLGTALVADGRLAEGERRLAADIADLRLRYPGSLPLSRALLLHAGALTAMGRLDTSGAELDESWRLWQRFAGRAAHPALGNPYRLEQSRLQMARGDAAGSLEVLDSVVAPTHPERPPAQVEAARAAALRAQAFTQQGRWSEAQRTASDALRTIEHSPLRERLPLLEAEAASALGQAYRLGGNAAGARAHLERAVALRVAHGAPESAWLSEARIALADCLVDLGDRESARQLVAAAKASHAAHSELGQHFKAPLTKVAARLEAETRSAAVAARP